MISNLVDTFIIIIWITLSWILPFSGLWSKCSLFSRSTELLPFPGLWLVEQFSCICSPNCGSDSTQIWWDYALSASSGLASFWSCSTKFPQLSVSDCWSRFHAFVDKLLIVQLSCGLLSQIIVSFPAWLTLVTLQWIAIVSLQLTKLFFFSAFATKLLLAQIC